MFPFFQPCLLAGAGFTRPSTPVAGGARNNATESTALNLAGAAVGDYILFFAVAAAATISGGDGAWEIASTPIRKLSKRLTAADLAAGALTCGFYPWAFAVYRKPRGHQQAATATVANADLVVPGFSKSSHSAGVVAAVHTSGPFTALAAPSGWTARQTAADGGGFAYDVIAIYDLLSPGIYVNGTSVTFTPGTGKALTGCLEELLNSGSGGGAGPGGPEGTTDFSEAGNPLMGV
ncbi:hypothetical protein [Phenylobacterium sp.]|jgi:hypothetical protein|uniref:hypothetical protein n=1 Tax=Phenylobacterium sp. TaxID=1871053 RepID=UPI002F3E869D